MSDDFEKAWAKGYALGKDHGCADIHDQFAMAALTGILASSANPDSGGPSDFDPDEAAKMAFAFAGACMKKREK